ncbi:sporulation protein [Laceyella putida]|uniref:Sporulation protein n=1 Tax=Laceyella putida TaxID=110101 RepID=A0ABW2RNL0_9BACL
MVLVLAMFVPQPIQAAGEYDVVLYFPLSRYPETGDHIRDAIAAGHPEVCTIDRDGADERREQSLEGWPTREGYDRDEWPMAMCLEGGYGADIRYISPSDNRGAGAWVGNQVEPYPDGTKVKFIVR